MGEDQPRPSDLLIMKQSHAAWLFLVGRDHDTPELSCKTYAEAAQVATETAKRLRVDVCVSEDGKTLERIVTCRSTAE